SLTTFNATTGGWNGDDGRGNPNPYYSQWNAINVHVKVYFCPADPTQEGGWAESKTSYGYNGQGFGIAYPWGWGQGFGRYPGTFSTDGTSNTIMFTEKVVQAYGNTTWAPDNGFNYWPDWGPSLASPEAGEQLKGPAAMFQVAPFRCPNGTVGPTCANGNAASTG